MGSTSFLTIREAANRLNLSKRTIHTYLTKGFLKRTVRDGKVLLLREEVEQLAVEMGADMPALTRRSFFELTAKVRKLEEQMALVQAMWNVQEKPLHPKPKEAEGLYRAATDFLTGEKWKFEDMVRWADLFVQFDEETLKAVGEACSTSKPWEVFFTLSTRMSDFLASTKEMKSDVRVQALKAKMDQGRRKVREAALFWIESGHGAVPVQVFQTLDSPREGLLRSLGARNGN